MPEGHTVHRTANQFAEHFAGLPLVVDSPQGRFANSANSVSGEKLVTASAVGKQLFLGFESDRVIRIHLGIYGKWQWHQHPGKSGFLTEPVVGQVRARFYTDQWLAELRGPTVCELITGEEVALVLDRLGPDPLNPDPLALERARFVHRVQRSSQGIGQLLMDQSVISGVGNVYRAELLFRCGLDPYVQGKNVPVELLESIWADAVKLLTVGVRTGVMITRDEFLAADPGKPERNFVYKREGEPCRVCGTSVSLAVLAGRKLYWCATCQK